MKSMRIMTLTEYLTSSLLGAWSDNVGLASDLPR